MPRSRKISYESGSDGSSGGIGSILPIALIGGIGYYLYSSGTLSNIFNSISSMFGSSLSSDPSVTNVPGVNANVDVAAIIPNVAAVVANGNIVAKTPEEIQAAALAAQQKSSTDQGNAYIANLNPDSIRGAMLAYWKANPSFAPAENNSSATYDQWNWLRGQVGGSSIAIEDAFPGLDRSELLTFDRYWSGAGLSGIRGLGNLGRIIDIQNFLSEGTPMREIRRGNFR